MANKKHSPLRHCLLLAGIAACAVSPAGAQDTQLDPGSINANIDDEPPEIGVETIVVTAQKREQNLQQTPLTISAVTADALEERGVSTIEDLASLVPNLTSTNGPQGSSDANFFVRGVGQFDFIITNDPGVGVYLDGVYLGRTVGALLDTGGVERIEILRGPQGTLFGRNTLGGAISVVSVEPDPGAFFGEAAATLGSRDRYEAEALVNVPLGQSAALKAFGFYREQDGPAENVLNGLTYGDVERYGAQASVLLEATPNIRLIVRGDYTADRGSPNGTVNVGVNPFFPFLPPDLTADRSDDFYDTFQSNDPDNELDIWGISATAEFDTGPLLIRSITAYRELEGFTTSDSDGTAYALYDQTSDIDQQQFSQELQFVGTALSDRLEYLLGLYYFEEEARQVQNLCFAPLTAAILGPQPRFGPCVAWLQDNDQKTTSYAIFGQANYDLTSALSVTLGGRYTWEDKEIVTTQSFNLPNGVTAVPIVAGLADELDFQEFTPRIGVDWQATDEILLFASYAKGFRSGGFNGRLVVPNNEVPSFEADTNDAFEVGVKSDLLDNRLRLNVTGFYSKYKDIQQTITDPTVQFRVANAGDAELYGIEVEATVVPTANALVNLAFGYTSSSFEDVDPLAGIAEGNRLPFSPEITFALGAHYEFETGFGSITPRADLRYQSDVFFSPFNFPLEEQEGYAILDLRLTYITPDERFSVTGAVENVFDREYFSFGQDAVANQGVAYSQVGMPREFSVTLRANF